MISDADDGVEPVVADAVAVAFEVAMVAIALATAVEELGVDSVSVDND